MFDADAAELVYNIGSEFQRQSMQNHQLSSSATVIADLQDTVTHGSESSETEVLYNAEVVSDLVYHIGNEISLQLASKQGKRMPNRHGSEFDDHDRVELISDDVIETGREKNDTASASGDFVYCKAASLSRLNSYITQPILSFTDNKSGKTEDNCTANEQISQGKYSVSPESPC
jgi:phage FluMu gp28-like protein